MTKDQPSETSAKLRHDIDDGKAGDKIGFPDPAAAPLGTDAEAGGASPTREELRMAHQNEVANRPDGPTAASDPRPVSPKEPSSGRQRGPITTVLLVTLLALAGLAALYAVLT